MYPTSNKHMAPPSALQLHRHSFQPPKYSRADPSSRKKLPFTMLVGAVLFSLRAAHCDYCGEIAMRVHTTRRGELYIDSALMHALSRPFN